MESTYRSALGNRRVWRFTSELHYVEEFADPDGASVDDAREKLDYDFYYRKNHSLVFDRVIRLRTVRVVLFGVGAR